MKLIIFFLSQCEIPGREGVRQNISFDQNTKDSSEHKMGYTIKPVNIHTFNMVFHSF